MILKKALDRLAWRFTSGNSFTPNVNDIEAFNNVIEWVNNQKSETINNNQLFAKLFIYFFNQKIKETRTTVFDDEAQKELSKILNTPLNLFYEAFKVSLQENMREYIYEKNGIDVKHPYLKDETEKEEDRLKIQNMKEKDFNRIIYDVYTIEEVTNQLDEMISEALNRFS